MLVNKIDILWLNFRRKINYTFDYGIVKKKPPFKGRR